MLVVYPVRSLILPKDPCSRKEVKMGTVIRIRTLKAIRGISPHSFSSFRISQFILESFCMRSHIIL